MRLVILWPKSDADEEERVLQRRESGHIHVVHGVLGGLIHFGLEYHLFGVQCDLVDGIIRLQDLPCRWHICGGWVNQLQSVRPGDVLFDFCHVHRRL